MRSFTTSPGPVLPTPGDASPGRETPSPTSDIPAGASISEPPFMLPPRELISLVVHAPFPPSVNQIWRHVGKRVYRSKPYTDWLLHCRALATYLKCPRGSRIEGYFAADIVLDRNERKRAGDLDNRIKALLDLAQAWELIANDKHCERLTAEWGFAPHGAVLTLTELCLS